MSTDTADQVDIAIVGAGAVGLAAALALSREGRSVALLGPVATPRDGRTVALLDGSWRMLADLGVRDALLEKLQEAKLQSRPAWTLMYRLPMYADCPRMDCNVAEDIADRLINIPSSAKLGRQEKYDG